MLDFRNFCKFFARFLRKFCVISTLHSRFILHWNAYRLAKELQQTFEGLRNHADRVHAVFMRAARRKFSGILQFFRASWAQICVIPTLDACFFSNLGAMLTRSTLSDVVQCAQRTLAECAQFLCAGRAGFPEFLQIFRPIFAQILRDLGAGLALYLALERAPTQKKDATKFFDFCNNAGRFYAIFLRAAPRSLREIYNFFARIRRKICVMPTLDISFFRI